ncbi:MOSC N-terminal beta barrel domain-containing protein [Janthinobacterium sp. 17J80-10]|uniref:MOSC domain-containing protein n=1 Tax=Janthinobacterium sp. 17J80-10 TaxID=2497863 RepID=UPI00100585D7|nr:MOSC N-terminal beta barrel domain-containing protein [Janthinobacterium sp. 17J80-10]QAU33379.1 MOSC domain-containing protein [Janthinobacterium sp. 17J80-10]
MPILASLTLYPVKSCAGIALREAIVTRAGLMSDQIYDREWMVVDAGGNFLTQREHPKMAAIVPQIGLDALKLRAPGMLRLEIPLGLPDPEDERLVTVKVWDDSVPAYDCDETTAAWFSSYLGVPCRLVRFHPQARRIASTDWTGGIEAPTLFGDGYPMLVISQGSLDDLNAKLAAQGRAALPMNRFRPNIVIDGIGAYEEDFAGSITVGGAVIKPVKPCPRCRIPSIDQSTGEVGPSPLDILQAYRADPKIDGGLAFGMNAILLGGENQVLRVGQDAEVTLAF